MTVRADVERIVENILCDLRIEVTDGGFTNPNSRKITLLLGNRVLDTAYFDVVQKREYED